MPRVVRKQRPPDLTDYKKYKPYLRLDFKRRCAYCHIPEIQYGTPGNFAVDHFRPKSNPEFRKLICRYSNLFYACRDCNLYKGSTWPDKDQRRLGFHFLNPCQADLSKHWASTEDGALLPKTVAAKYMIAELRLNRPYLLEFRRRKAARMVRIKLLEEILSVTPRRTWTNLKGQQLLDDLKRELLDEFGNFWR